MAQDRKRAARFSCAICGRPRPAFAMEVGDPYCSVRCAKRAHGVRESFSATEDRTAARPGKAIQQRHRGQRAWRRTFHAWAERRMNPRRVLTGADE
jgi:hypothetical protein